ncbi:TBC1 domain family member 1 isoform X2 [Pectinophora gossypiella]|uniref:TBC1 domain family member 1 isoform X2 n=1 Tax=Pectinophora gossypiella TaxID=13191 RepID=UPI00214E9F3B|nr:TBC1 domain family member 1 isoform X2 [Pectinophora gossypiella]
MSHSPNRPPFGSHSDTSAINIKQLVSELFTQMREPSAGAGSPRGSNSSLAVTRNVGFQQTSSADHLPWTPPAMPRAANTNLASESQSGLVRSISNASALTSLCADLSPSDSHFFEVLYIGKVRISQRKVPESLIDDALNKFAQHEAEKALTRRRHSLLSSTGTSVYSNDSTENIDDKKIDDVTSRKLNLQPSTTPLEEKNQAWNSTENIRVKGKDNIDKEFDLFTKERIKKPQPLEPNVLVINVPSKNNLGTVSEDEEKLHSHEEIRTGISETASSITEFCQQTVLNDNNITKNNNRTVSNTDNRSDDNTNNNPFFDEFAKNNSDPLLQIPLKIDEGEKDTNLNAKSSTNKTIKTDNKNTENVTEINMNTQRNVHVIKNDAKITENVEKTDVKQEHMNFEEIQRKPTSAVQNKLDSNEGRRNSPMPENKPFLRDRSASIGSLNLKTPITQLIGEQNRTMLFQVGRSELRLISPDRKQILLHRAFKDVASCVLGRTNKNHFGFVCRENVNDAYACYVFKCESDSVALEVINAIKQAFVAHAELLKKSREKSPNMTCEHCPMLWYHRLCHDVEGMNEKKTHAFILRRIEQLPDDEQDLIITKYQGGTNHMYEVTEHNAFLMMLLRAHCEAKQQRHVHDTAENRSEFLNQYLGGSTIFMKAKRSLSSGFDHLLKRRASRDDGTLPPLIKKEASPAPPVDSLSESTPELLTPEFIRSKSLSPAIISDNPPSPLVESVVEEEAEDLKDEAGTPVNSPMMDIFLKVSDNRPSISEPGVEPDATWRQAIYEKVVHDQVEGELTPKVLLGRPSAPRGRRNKEELRQLWKLAIDQTILLVRMEKENDKLRESEESSAVRRIKLEYTELGACDTGISSMWESLLSCRNTCQPAAKVDRHMLTQAVKQGVPRMSRGGVWYFLAEQYCLRAPPPDVRAFPHYHENYRTLLSGLTKHQHAILIDLGRTFPKHGYFAVALGPGQLSLYNILKAYSLLDPDVGYCQGLSFVAGVLLLHMEEAEAFVLLRHLMFRRGLRKQYLPDMSALQVQLYQLSRLLRDHEPELHAKLEYLDISPALYAAPWMLTLFTSQFPLGFVVRVFDLIFLESLDVVFSVSLALLSAHKDGLMLCESCEEAAEYLKHKLPDMGQQMYHKVMKKVHSLDISRQLSDYAIEYAVLREEMPRMAALTDDNRKLNADKIRMTNELDAAMDAITNYQKTVSRLESQNKMLEQQLTLLSRYLTAHHKQELPLEIKKIIQNYSKKISFSSKILKFGNNDEDEESPKNKFKTGQSAPNLFAKISREEVLNAVNKEKNRVSPETDRKHFLMKKSQSVHSGLIANNLKQYPLKVLEEKSENRSDTFRTEILTESLKEIGKRNTGFFANTHEQIRQERLFEQQLKHDFDQNLKKLDSKITPTSYIDDVNIFQSRKSMSLNLRPTNENSRVENKGDSGFVTPLSPKDDKIDTSSIISHPLSDCDVDIKFDGQSTKLKQIRPIRGNGGQTIGSKNA